MHELWDEGDEERGAGEASSRGVRTEMGVLRCTLEMGTR